MEFGGLDIACGNRGHAIVGACEIDEHARAVYASHLPDVPIHKDATELDPAVMPDIDCLVASPPCQSFSTAGKRGGISDARGTLFFEVFRVIEAKRPGLVLGENVPGLLSIDGGDTLRKIIGIFDDLHYDTVVCVMDAANHSAQSRKRVFIAGTIRDERNGSMQETFTTGILQEPQRVRQQSLVEGDRAITILSLLDSLAEHFQACGNGDGFRMPEAYHLLTLYGCSDPKDHSVCFLETFQNYHVLKSGRLEKAPPSAMMKYSVMRNGVMINMRAAMRKTKNDSTLSDVLEPPDSVPEKYYLGERSLRTLVLHGQKHRDSGHGFAAEIRTPDKKSATVCARDGRGGAMRYVSQCGIPSGKIHTVFDSNLELIGRSDQEHLDESPPILEGNADAVGADGDMAHDIMELYQIVGVGNSGQGEQIYLPDGKAASLTANDAKRHAMHQVAYLRKNFQGQRVYSPDGKACTLKAEGGGWGAKTGLYMIPRLLATRGKYGEGRRVFGTDAKAATLTSADAKRHEHYVPPDLPTPTHEAVRDAMERMKRGEHVLGDYEIVHSWIMSHMIRRLMPIECERLQGFPQNWTEAGINGKPQADTHRYQQMGNAVSVPTVEHVLGLMGM